MAALCVDCADELSFGRWLIGHERCARCHTTYQREQAELAADEEEELRRQREHEQREFDAAVAAYWEVLEQLWLGGDLRVVLPRIVHASEITPLAAPALRDLKEQALSAYIDELVADDALTKQEDVLLGQVTAALGVELSPRDSRRYLLAACNAGLMPRDQDPQIVLNKDEIAYWRTPAGLLTERTVKEYRTNHQSLSIPLGGGFRYRAGQSRGRQVVVGTSVEVADQGDLTITSQRVVFAGTRQALEVPLKRLLGVNLFGDGIGLQIANRKTVPSFHVGPGPNEVVAAILHAAAQRFRGTFVPVSGRPVASMQTPPLPRLLAQSGYRDPPVVAPARPREGSQPKRHSEQGQPAKAQGRVSPHVARLFAELRKSPGVAKEIAQMEALWAIVGGSEEQLEDHVRRLYEMASRSHFPPALTPMPPDRWDLPVQPVVRETTASAEGALEALLQAGLTPVQVAGLREDFRRGQVEDWQLDQLLEILRERDQTPSGPAKAPPPPPASVDDSEVRHSEVAVRVYRRAGRGSRTRQLLDILAGAEYGLTPAEIGQRMRRPDGEPAVDPRSVRAAVRNLRRIEKGLRNRDEIDREVLVVDSSDYARDGANRYTLRSEDKASILRLD